MVRVSLLDFCAPLAGCAAGAVPAAPAGAAALVGCDAAGACVGALGCGVAAPPQAAARNARAHNVGTNEVFHLITN
jgi:hypothetical protein